jgi:hypothetical protein
LCHLHINAQQKIEDKKKTSEKVISAEKKRKKSGFNTLNQLEKNTSLYFDQVVDFLV